MNLVFTLILMVHFHDSRISFYQPANSLIESREQVCICTSRLAKQLFMKTLNSLRSSPPSEYKKLSKKTVFISVNLLIFGGGTSEAYSERCQKYKMEKIVSTFLFLQNASSSYIWEGFEYTSEVTESFLKYVRVISLTWICKSKKYKSIQVYQ